MRNRKAVIVIDLVKESVEIKKKKKLKKRYLKNSQRPIMQFRG